MVSDRVQIKVWSETLVSDQSKVSKAKQSKAEITKCIAVDWSEIELLRLSLVSDQTLV